MTHNPDYEKAALEIYMLFRRHPGSISTVSGYLKRNDSSKFSRQINPTDEQRDNPYVELLEIHEAMLSFSPGLEAEIWKILERERTKKLQAAPVVTQLAELMRRIHTELGDVVCAREEGASRAELQKEGFELLQAVRDFYEKIKQLSE
ncbi:MAG TPA: hypothetical protein VGC76_14605 [Pyrinomonadaceae bacterium]|jgi:hypothetical protein